MITNATFLLNFHTNRCQWILELRIKWSANNQQRGEGQGWKEDGLGRPQGAYKKWLAIDKPNISLAKRIVANLAIRFKIIKYIAAF